MGTAEKLIEDWIGNEAVAEQILTKEDGAFVFHGEKNDYLIEIRAFNLGPQSQTRRLTEPHADDLEYS